MRRALYAGCFMILAALPNCGNTTDSSLSAAAKPITLRTDSIGLTQVHTANATLIKLGWPIPERRDGPAQRRWYDDDRVP